MVYTKLPEPALMHKRFQMSSKGELAFFLGLQVKQSKEGIFLSLDNYAAEILKKFDFSSVKTASTPIETHKPLVKDEEAADCKKQTIVATSTTEAEYVAAANCCRQHIEIRHHFIKDSYEKKLIQVLKIHTDDNVAGLLTKAFDVSRFNFLKANIRVLNL
nr:ribonuclease H-like domain, reverse transcriptase, RNA-dependent DNA polymerase [Tanacetum cinerariifolium]